MLDIHIHDYQSSRTYISILSKESALAIWQRIPLRIETTVGLTYRKKASYPYMVSGPTRRVPAVGRNNGKYIDRWCNSVVTR